MNKTFKIEGMSCGHCIMAVQKKLSGLNLKKIDVKKGFAEVEFDESIIKVSDIVKAIEEAGYKVVE